MHDDWIPCPRVDLDVRTLDLAHEEGYLLSRLDGSTRVGDLQALTGLPEDRVVAILERLASQGALENRPALASQVRERSEAREGGDDDRGAGDETSGRSWRQIFEQELHPLDVDVRVERAGTATGDVLRALCHDPHRRVVDALLENSRFGLEHARLVARHHRSSRGLDALGEHAGFLRDPQVERHLFRNPQTSVRLLQRMFVRARMAKIYRLAVGHDATERVRETSKREFRKKFASGTAEERTKLILDCEGRCLALLIGLSLDAKTVALLRGRALTSTLLIRNLARWPATPPPLLAHILRQPQVQRNAALKNVVLRHPNVPAEAKRVM